MCIRDSDSWREGLGVGTALIEAAKQAARKAGDQVARAAAERQAMAVPMRVLALCATQSTALAAFLPRCNPQLVSDVGVGIQLLAGAGRAAWATALAGTSDQETRDRATPLLAALRQAEAACG